MSELCIDASVALKLVLKGEPYRAEARRLLRDCRNNGVTLIAPPFFDAEVDSAICKQVFTGKLTLARAKQAWTFLDQLDVRLTTHPDLRQRAREFAERFNQRAVYDCTYAALAELRCCEFWTADKAFFDAVRSALPFVKHLPDYP